MTPDIGTGATIFGCAGPALLPEERAFFREADPFGFILFARNVETPDQLRRLTHDLREAVGRDAPILVDQEGGRVQRLRAPHWREWEPPLDTVARFARIEDAARAMHLRARIIAPRKSRITWPFPTRSIPISRLISRPGPCGPTGRARPALSLTAWSAPALPG